jgi:O-antigen/teichoic acid export membrane protein
VGIIRRQSIQSSILFYIGAAIGFLTRILIFPNYLDTDELGLTSSLLFNALFYAQFAAIGFGTMTLRFFPYFQDRSRRHHDFLTVLLLIPAAGFFIVTLLVVLFRGPLLSIFVEKSPLMVDYFWYLIPLSLATLYFDLLDAYLRSLMKTVVPILFREIVQRVFMLVSVMLYAFDWIDFPQFVFVYVALLSSVTVLMVIYIYWLGHLHINLRASWRMRKLFRRILVYGSFTLLGNISAITLNTIDSLMLSAYVGLDAVGIYTTSLFVTTLILIPWRAIQKVSSPQVAEHWRSGGMAAMDRLYKRTSLINMGIGCYLLFAMICGMDTLYTMLPKEYSQGGMVMIIMGASKLLEMITGLNGYIMVTSKYFRMDLIFNLLLVFMVILLNIWLIPLYNITGAAIATAAALAVSNIFRLGFLWWKLNLHPFTIEMLSLAVLTAVAFLGQWLLPTIWNVYLSFAVRITCFTVLFVVPLLYFRLIPDVNRLYDLVLKKIFR